MADAAASKETVIGSITPQLEPLLLAGVPVGRLVSEAAKSGAGADPATTARRSAPIPSVLAAVTGKKKSRKAGRKGGADLPAAAKPSERIGARYSLVSRHVAVSKINRLSADSGGARRLGAAIAWRARVLAAAASRWAVNTH